MHSLLPITSKKSNLDTQAKLLVYHLTLLMTLCPQIFGEWNITLIHKNDGQNSKNKTQIAINQICPSQQDSVTFEEQRWLWSEVSITGK